MAALTYQYVYFSATGAHTRQPRATNSYGGFTPIPGLNFPSSQDLTVGSPFAVPQNQFPATQVINGITYKFSFMSVVGCAPGGLTSTTYNSYPMGTVLSAVTVLVVYLPHGGISLPGGTTGAVIDAFNESTGSLADNNFVVVSPDPSGNLTTYANVQGFVDSAASNMAISADIPTMQPYLGMSNPAVFDKWVILDPTTDPTTYSISGNKLTVNKGCTIFAFAFYINPTPKHGKDFPDKHKESFQEGVKLVFEKGGKELAEWVDPIDYISDPEAYLKRIQGMVEKLSSLQTQIKGRSFINAADRPAVGKAVAAKAKAKPTKKTK